MSIRDSIKRAINERAEQLAETLPERIQLLIRLCNTDLYAGPVYGITEDDEAAQYGDEYKEPFSFTDATKEIREALEAIEADNLYFESWSGFIEKKDEPEEEDYIVERQDIIRAIVGSELFPYVR